MGNRCRILLYTSFLSNRSSCEQHPTSFNTSGACDSYDHDNDENELPQVKLADPCCSNIESPTPNVTVYPAHPRGSACVSEADFLFYTPGEKKVVFQTLTNSSQLIYYTVDVYETNTVLDPCVPSPCVNSVCYHHGTDFRCLCPAGFTGRLCEKNIDDCASEPCENGGSCIDGLSTFSCICRSGFTGKLCQTDIDECLSQPCLNGGLCKDGVNLYSCQCTSGFWGEMCQTAADPCVPSPCVRGVCFSHESDFLCDCPPHYTGKRCDLSVQLELWGPSIEYVHVQQGSLLALNCSATGTSSQLNYHWSKKYSCGSLFRNTSRAVYYKQHAEVGDEGTYNCLVTGDHNQSVVKTFHVSVILADEVVSCNFDNDGFCGWTQKTSDSFDWTLQAGPTLTDDTGPDTDHSLQTAQGKYLYIESSSPRAFGEDASLMSPLLPANHTLCFEFWYFMYGDGIGSLIVNIEDSCLHEEATLFRKEGDQGQSWYKASMTIDYRHVPNDYIIVITGFVGRSYHGDIAVDDFHIYGSACKDKQGSPPIVG